MHISFDIETIHLWSAMLKNAKFRYQLHQHNICADHLARLSISSMNDRAIYNTCPSFLIPYVLHDSDNCYQ